MFSFNKDVVSWYRYLHIAVICIAVLCLQVWAQEVFIIFAGMIGIIDLGAMSQLLAIGLQTQMLAKAMRETMHDFTVILIDDG